MQFPGRGFGIPSINVRAILPGSRWTLGTVAGYHEAVDTGFRMKGYLEMTTLALALAIGFASISAADLPVITPTKTEQVFNGKDLSGFYTFIKDRGRNVDPRAVFTVKDGEICISGEELGCITSEREYTNYRLVVEFKWGQRTWAGREKAARDSGVLLHSVGEDGAYGGIWMHSIECQLIEGGTGDFIVVGDGSDKFSITSPVAPEKSGDCYVYKPDGQRVAVNSGRINWFGRDPEWKDVKDFRGKRDAEKPVGEWNKYELIADGTSIHVILNGVTVNECFDVRPSTGRIQVQSEGAEIFIRRIEVSPIEAKK